MKLIQITVENFLGVRAAHVALSTPITLFAGDNAAGKSSLQEAVRMALVGEPVRVNLKKEYTALVSDGAPSGYAEVVVAGGPTGSEQSSITLPSGKTAASNGYAAPPALPYVLDAQRFSSLDDKARRSFLFNLVGLRVTPEAVQKRMEAKGLDAAKTKLVLPLLRAGFEAASTDAKSKATEAKGAWRALTGETYGEKKAEGWKATKPEHDATALQRAEREHAESDAKVADLNQKLGALRSDRTRHQDAQKRAAALRETADKAERIRTKLATDGTQLAEWQATVARLQAAAGTAPRVGNVHDLAKAVHVLLPSLPLIPEDEEADVAAARAALGQYEQEHGPVVAKVGDPGDAAKLQSAIRSRDLIDSAVANDKRDLQAAEKAGADLAAIEAEQAPDTSAMEILEQELATISQARTQLQAKITALRQAKTAAEAADKKTVQAAGHHADVLAWGAIGDALAPDGIPSDMLAEALGPINARLEQSAVDAEWPVVAIGADMAITAGGRPLNLLSESERWRVDAMLAEAISFRSDLKLLVLDRFDVLDAKGRADLLAWLDVLADAGELDTALLFGTLKALPTGLPATATAEWINHGHVGQLKEAA